MMVLDKNSEDRQSYYSSSLARKTFSNRFVGHKPQFFYQMRGTLLLSCISQRQVVLRGGMNADEVNGKSRAEADRCRPTLVQVKMRSL